MRYIAKEYGKSYNATILNKNYFNITNSRDAEKVLSASKNLEMGEIFRFFESFMKQGLFTAQGKKWKIRRKILTPTLHISMLKNYFKTFV